MDVRLEVIAELQKWRDVAEYSRAYHLCGSKALSHLIKENDQGYHAWRLCQRDLAKARVERNFLERIIRHLGDFQPVVAAESEDPVGPCDECGKPSSEHCLCDIRPDDCV